MAKKIYRFETTVTLTVFADTALGARQIAAAVKADIPGVVQAFGHGGVKVRAGGLTTVPKKED